MQGFKVLYDPILAYKFIYPVVTSAGQELQMTLTHPPEKVRHRQGTLPVCSKADTAKHMNLILSFLDGSLAILSDRKSSLLPSSLHVELASDKARVLDTVTKTL